MSARCVECGRMFDLLTDAPEIVCGHHCEVKS